MDCPIYGFTDRLEEAIRESGLNASEICRRAECSRHMLWQWRNYGYVPRLKSLMRLAIVLNVSIDWLVGLKNEKQ